MVAPNNEVSTRMVLAKNISYVYILYYLAMIGKDFLIPIRSH